jgi:hypothetical protein
VYAKTTKLRLIHFQPLCQALRTVVMSWQWKRCSTATNTWSWMLAYSAISLIWIVDRQAAGNSIVQYGISLVWFGFNWI